MKPIIEEFIEFLIFICIASICWGQTVDRYVVKHANVVRSGKFPTQALKPQTYGFEEVEFSPGDYTRWVFSPTQAARFIGVQGVTLGGGMLQGVDGATFEDFRIAGTWQIREAWTAGTPVSKNCKWLRCEFTSVNGIPWRARFGATNLTLEDCYFHRTGPIPLDDVPAVYFSDYTASQPCTFTIKGCDFAGYTDAIQLGADGSNEIYVDCLIDDCQCWVPDEYLIDLGIQMAPGLENFIDIKGNSKFGYDTVIRDCRAVGFRPSVYVGGGGPGYPFTIHETAGNIRFERTIVMQCECGWNVKGTTDRNIILEDCQAIQIRNNGAVTPWPSKQGSVITSTGTIHATRLLWREIDRLEELPDYPFSPPRTYIDCGEFF